MKCGVVGNTLATTTAWLNSNAVDRIHPLAIILFPKFFPILATQTISEPV